MKIVHLIHNFPPEFRGGTEVYLEALSREQIAAGHDLTVIAGSEQMEWRDNFVDQEVKGIPVKRFHRLPQGEEFSIDFYLERFEELFLNFLQQEKPDLVHLHHWMNLGNELLRIAADASIPSVLTLHDLYPLCPRFFMTKPDGTRCGPEPCPQEECLACSAISYRHSEQMMEGEFRVRKESFSTEFVAAGRIVIPSRSHAEPYLKANLMGAEDPVVLHHGLVRPVSRTVWKENREGPLQVGTWGNLVPQKGIHILLAAIRAGGEELAERVELHLHGKVIDSGYEEELKEAARGLKVHFHGDFSGVAPDQMASGLDLAVFPSLARESYSMVLDEAIALGLPVVVSDAGALPERVGEGGIVSPAGDAAALADVLISLEKDRSRLEELSRSIQKMAVTVKHNSEALMKIYEEVIREGPKTVPNRAQLKRNALLKGRVESLCHEADERDGLVLLFSRFREFVPLRDFASLPQGNVMILAPHPDDEVIGCGGVTALHASRGDQVSVVHLTDGSSGGESEKSGHDLVSIRMQEAEAAGKVLGTERFFSLGFKDGQLIPKTETIDKVYRIFQDLEPDVVYGPSPFEIHPDHLAALFIMFNILERKDHQVPFLMYEVNEAMVPGFLIDITAVRETKDRALACFESQIRLNDVRDKSMSGARWRTANVDIPEVTHAEAFIQVKRENLRGLIARTKDVVRYIGQGFDPLA